MNQTTKYGIIAGNLINNSNSTYLVTDMVEKPEAAECAKQYGNHWALHPNS